QREWVSFRHVFGQVGGTGPAGQAWWLRPANFFGSQFGMLFGPWLVAFLAAGWRFRPARASDSGVQLLWWCSIPVWALFAAASFVKSGQPNWPAPAYVAGLVLAVAWVRERLAGSYLRWVFVAAVLIGLFFSLLMHYPAIV